MVHPKRKGGRPITYLAGKNVNQALFSPRRLFFLERGYFCGAVMNSGELGITEWNVDSLSGKILIKWISFPNLTEEVLGDTGKKIYQGKYLHYKQAETNTSFAKLVFNRDDMDQKVRSTEWCRSNMVRKIVLAVTLHFVEQFSPKVGEAEIFLQEMLPYWKRLVNGQRRLTV